MSVFLKYIVKVAFFYLLGWLLYHLLFALSDPKGFLNYPSYLKWMDPFELISILLIYPSIWILKLMGIEAHAYSGMIWAPSIVVLIIKVPCLAIKIMIAWLSIILPYKPLKKKYLFALYGILLIHFLNILRMTGIVYGASIHQHWSRITHDLLNYIAYGLLILFFIWITQSDREPNNQKTS